MDLVQALVSSVLARLLPSAIHLITNASGHAGGGHQAQARLRPPLAAQLRPQLAEEERRGQETVRPGLDHQDRGG